MIKVKRSPIPKVLADHQSEWTATLMKLVSTYGSYRDIPKAERDAIVNKYRHEDIKQAIQKMFHGKCVFCESNVEASGYVQIEHFYPKSLYPECTFEWRNLFPACHKCNIEKGEHDTYTSPIVNPEQDDPAMYFIYQDIRIRPAPTSPDQGTSERTIRVCDLRRRSLYDAFSKILPQFRENEDALEEKVEKYHQSKQEAKHLSNIHEALKNLKATSAATEPYAGFIRYLLRNSEAVRKAMELINANQKKLALSNPFELY